MKRRTFLETMALAGAALSTEVVWNPFTTLAQDPNSLDWHRAPCRFCGTGCSVMLGVKDNKIQAVKGDSKSPVNQGTLCIKGYSLPFIQYGQDRLKKPLVRMTNGKYDAKGKLTETDWDTALDLMAQKAKTSLKKGGPPSVAMFGSGQWTIWEGYAALKLWKSGPSVQQPGSQCPTLHGFGGGRIYDHLWDGRTHGVL